MVLIQKVTLLNIKKELERLRTTVNTGIEELKHTAEATEVKINSEVETAKALDTQLKALQSAINSNQLATREDLTSQIKTIKRSSCGIYKFT